MSQVLPTNFSAMSLAGQQSQDVCVVTVTYGDRRHMLLQMLEGSICQGVKYYVVVNNGATWNVNEIKTLFPELEIEIVNMARNSGSALGYATGIQQAYNLGKPFIWLLDDDNKPEVGCLEKLLETYQDETLNTRLDSLAVLAFRPEHQPDVALGVPQKFINPRRSSFRGFHIADIPYKIWRRVPWLKPRKKVPERIQLYFAPYSGLLFRRELINKIGLPNQSFILYADDNEFTWRITSLGGRITLVTTALLHEIENSWNQKSQHGNSFKALLFGENDFRVYYSVRNQAYFDKYVYCESDLYFSLNYIFYMIILRVFSYLYKKRDRFKLVQDAINDGLRLKLGFNSQYSL